LHTRIGNVTAGIIDSTARVFQFRQILSMGRTVPRFLSWGRPFFGSFSETLSVNSGKVSAQFEGRAMFRDLTTVQRVLLIRAAMFILVLLGRFRGVDKSFDQRRNIAR